MTSNHRHAGRRIAVTLPLVGTALAGIVGAWLWHADPSEPAQPYTQILGSALVLLALGGLVALGAYWRTPFAAGIARLVDRAQARAPRLLRLLRRRRLTAAIAALVATVWLSLAFHDIAYSHDHAEHCFKAFHFWHEMLGRGRLKGWSHFLAFGYPSGELTPFGPELWVALFRVATLGLLSWTQTYALAFAGVVVFAIGTVYYFTRRYFGRAAGLIAAVVWALDPGGWYQGGWFWFEWLGVWPVTLAMTFALLAHVKLIDILAADERPTDASSDPRRDAVWAASFMLASLVVHQLPIVVYAVTLPCLLLAVWLRGPRLSVARVLAFGATITLGIGLAAFYLIPMLARNELSQDLGVRGFALDELGRRLVEMRVFDAGWAPVAVLGFFGCVRAIRNRTAVGLFFVLAVAVFVLLSSDILVSVFHVERLMPGILKIECQRMLLIAKLFWFPLAGEAAVGALRAVARGGGAAAPGGTGAASSPPMSPARQLVAILIVAALGAPVARPLALHLFNTQVDRSIEHRGATPLAADLHAFFQWSMTERRAHPDEPYRIAYSLNEQHDHIVSISPVFNETLLYKVGYTSAQQFRDFPMTGRPELFEALSVKYLLTDHDVAAPGLVHLRDFGQLRLYRLAGYRERHPFTLTGAGRAELLEFSPERIRLRLEGISTGARLKLHVARFPRWEATIDGRAIPITPATVKGMEYPLLMEVPAADGELVFRYTRRAPDWAGVAITAIALALWVLLATGKIEIVGRQPWAHAAWSLIRHHATRGAALTAIAMLIAVAAAVAKLAVPPRLPPDSLLAIAASAGGQISLAGVPCVARGATHWQCGPHKVGQEVRSGAYGSHVCLSAPQVGSLAVSVSAKLGRFLQTTFDPAGNAPGRVRVWLDGGALGDELTQGSDQGLQFLQVETGARAGTTGNLRVEVEGPPLHCFDLRLVR